MNDQKIELFFLKNLLQIAFVGVSIILVADIVLTFHYDARSVLIDVIILTTTGISFFLLKTNRYKASVILITTVPLVAEFYQATRIGSTHVPFTAILTIGFAFSILLKGRILWFMQIVTMAGLICLFILQAQNPELYGRSSLNQVITTSITYMVLYTLVVLSAGALKARYDYINQELKLANHVLIEKSNEIEAQNEELIQSQEKLNTLNQFLEETVEQRTRQIIRQNEKLLRYAHANAHHVRGPIARVLGLIQLSKLDPSLELPFIFEKIEHETNQIDSIISRINIELEKNID